MKTMILCLFLVPQIIFAQNPDNKPSTAIEKAVLDSIFNLIDDKSLTLEEKHSIANSVTYLPYPDYLQVLKRVLHYGKLEKDKWGAINSYCTIYSTISTYEDDMIKGKAYIDSAYALIDQTDDLNMKGGVHYSLGMYYASIPESEEVSHENLYKAIYYFDQTNDNNIRVAHSYFLLGVAYINRKDLESTKKIADKILNVELKNNERVFLINTYSVVADYYDLAKENDSINFYTYNDSVIYYHKKIIETYESLLDSVPGLASQKAPIIASYNRLALALADQKNTNWKQVMYNIELGGSYIDSTAHRLLMRHHATKGKVLLKQENFTEAKISFLKEKELLASLEELSDTQFSYMQLYKSLSLTLEGLNQHKEALIYERLAVEVEQAYNKKNRYEDVKNIEIKYQTAQKELEISQLNEDKQKVLFQRTIIISIAIFITIILFLAFLYNRIKNLKREKEAILLTTRIEQKEIEYKILHADTERRLIKRHNEGRELERKMLAKELHDSVANEVISIMMQSQAGASQEEINLLLKRTHDQIRQISHELMPPELNYISWVDLIDEYTIILNKTTLINFKITVLDADMIKIDEISNEHAKELYYIVQEAIGNILKHGEAKNVEINIHYDEKDQLILCIIDDGKGFNAEVKFRGIGLRTMKDRALGIGAELNINSVIGKGTEIAIILANPMQHHPEK